MFKKLAIVGTVLVGGLLTGTAAQAKGPKHGHKHAQPQALHHEYGPGYGYGPSYGYGRGYAYRPNWYQHERLHDHLDHNEYHRELEHREAHRYPMTPWQHGRLHDELDHDRFHDELLHRDVHRSHRYHYQQVPAYRQSLYPYSYPQGRSSVGIGISRYGFSLQIGR